MTSSADDGSAPVDRIRQQAACTTLLIGEIRAGYPGFPFAELPPDFADQLRK